MLASVKALPEDERKGKLPENDKFVALEGKLFEEIPDEVLLESLSLSFERIRHFCQAKLSV